MGGAHAPQCVESTFSRLVKPGYIKFQWGLNLLATCTATPPVRWDTGQRRTARR